MVRTLLSLASHFLCHRPSMSVGAYLHRTWTSRGDKGTLRALLLASMVTWLSAGSCKMSGGEQVRVWCCLTWGLQGLAEHQ